LFFDSAYQVFAGSDLDEFGCGASGS